MMLRPAREDEAAEETALAFLRAMEERDLERARSLLADGFRLEFPGASYASLEEMVSAAGGRYGWVRKRVARVESLAGQGREVVYVTGTLYGENLAGVPFDGVRFIDRFELVGGRIARQEVWNDLAESGALTRRG
jgi:hypothetical protein